MTHPRPSRRRAVLFGAFSTLLSLGALSCQAPPRDLYGLYVASLEDHDLASSQSTPAEVAERQDGRIELVRSEIRKGNVDSAEGHLWAAGVLSLGNEREDLELALEQAQRAFEGGEKRGGLLIAEAIDKLLVMHDERQRFGTQLVLDTRNGRWQLFPVDPATTDAERAELGLPPLADLAARAAQMNATHSGNTD